jgi:hypothetical protein
MRKPRIQTYTATIIMIAMLYPIALTASVPAKQAAYFGGTVAVFGAATKPVLGELDTSHADRLEFTARAKPFTDVRLVVPYQQIVDIEYGQKAGRRVGAAIGTAIALGPLGFVTLFSKKRNHFLTIEYMDGDRQQQVAVLELGKDIVRTTLAIVKVKTSVPIQYQDEEAEKAGFGK